MRCVGEWHRPYEVNRSGQIFQVLFFLAAACLCFNGVRPFGGFDIHRNLFLVLRDPFVDVFVLLALLSCWVGVRTGVYVGDAGVMVRVGFRRIVVPWQEIAYATVAEVPKSPVILQRGPSLGLVLVAPSGYGRPMPVRLPASFTLRYGRGSPPYIRLTPTHMNQVVDRINEMAAYRRPQPGPPAGDWLFPPR